MFEKNANELFAKQFEPDDKGYLFRANQQAAPVRVTNAERDAFVANYKRFNSRLTWGGIAALFSVIGVLVIIYDDVPESMIVVLTILFCLIIGVSGYWSYTAPNRELKHRSPVGVERSKTEM